MAKKNARKGKQSSKAAKPAKSTPAKAEPYPAQRLVAAIASAIPGGVLGQSSSGKTFHVRVKGLGQVAAADLAGNAGTTRKGGEWPNGIAECRQRQGGAYNFVPKRTSVPLAAKAILAALVAKRLTTKAAAAKVLKGLK